MLFGSLVGLARMSAGGHYLSDVIWAGFLCYLVSYLLYYYGFRIPEYEKNYQESDELTTKPQKKIAFLSVLLLLLLSAGALAMYPYETKIAYKLPATEETATAPSFRFFCDTCQLIIQFTGDSSPSSPAIITGFPHGNGFPKSRLLHGLRMKKLKSDQTEFYFEMTTEGSFLEMNNEITLTLAPQLLSHIDIAVEEGDISIRKMPKQKSTSAIKLSVPKGRVYSRKKALTEEELKQNGFSFSQEHHHPEPP